jgi:hypothetical protein
MRRVVVISGAGISADSGFAAAPVRAIASGGGPAARRRCRESPMAES